MAILALEEYLNLNNWSIDNKNMMKEPNLAIRKKKTGPRNAAKSVVEHEI